MSYASTGALISRYPSLASQDPIEMQAELDAASRWIDGHCHRQFSLDETVTVRYFAADDRYELDLGAFEIGTNDSVVIATDDGSGLYSTTVSESSYQLEPVNAPFASPDPRPFTSVRALGGYWPTAATSSSRQERVRVTARYGWPAVPEPVVRACLTLTASAFENPGGVRSESIDGYSVTYLSAGGVEVGVPPFVLSQVGPYVRGWAA